MKKSIYKKFAYLGLAFILALGLTIPGLFVSIPARVVKANIPRPPTYVEMSASVSNSITWERNKTLTVTTVGHTDQRIMTSTLQFSTDGINFSPFPTVPGNDTSVGITIGLGLPEGSLHLNGTYYIIAQLQNSQGPWGWASVDIERLYYGVTPTINVADATPLPADYGTWVPNGHVLNFTHAEPQTGAIERRVEINDGSGWENLENGTASSFAVTRSGDYRFTLITNHYDAGSLPVPVTRTINVDKSTSLTLQPVVQTNDGNELDNDWWDGEATITLSTTGTIKDDFSPTVPIRYFWQIGGTTGEWNEIPAFGNTITRSGTRHEVYYFRAETVAGEARTANSSGVSVKIETDEPTELTVSEDWVSIPGSVTYTMYLDDYGILPGDYDVWYYAVDEESFEGEHRKTTTHAEAEAEGEQDWEDRIHLPTKQLFVASTTVGKVYYFYVVTKAGNELQPANHERREVGDDSDKEPAIDSIGQTPMGDGNLVGDCCDPICTCVWTYKNTITLNVLTANIGFSGVHYQYKLGTTGQWTDMPESLTAPGTTGFVLVIGRDSNTEVPLLEYEGDIFFRTRRYSADPVTGWIEHATPAHVHVDGKMNISLPPAQRWSRGEMVFTLGESLGEPGDVVWLVSSGDSGVVWSSFTCTGGDYDWDETAKELTLLENVTYTITLKNSAGAIATQIIEVEKIEFHSPQFDVFAPGNEGVPQQSDITFTIVPKGDIPVSNVTYRYSIGGGAWVDTYLEEIGAGVWSLVINWTVTGEVRFIAAYGEEAWEDAWTTTPLPGNMHFIQIDKAFSGTLLLSASFDPGWTSGEVDIALTLIGHGGATVPVHYFLVDASGNKIEDLGLGFGTGFVYPAKDNGTYRFFAESRTRESNTLTVEIASIIKLPPSIKSSTGEDLVGRIFKSNLTLRIDDFTSVKTVAVTDANGALVATEADFDANGELVLSKNGVFTVVVTNNANVATTVSFTIDKPDYTMMIIIIAGSVVLLAAIAFLTFTTVRNKRAFKRLLIATQTGEDPGQFIMYKKVKK